MGSESGLIMASGLWKFYPEKKMEGNLSLMSKDSGMQIIWYILPLAGYGQLLANLFSYGQHQCNLW